ncbi:MAG: glycosyltransferase family 2 protein [Bacteroidota bacterium]
MDSYPKISIITPNFNGGPFLEETLKSVINQKYPNLEFIVIDGGSTDESVEIIKSYEKDLTYWVSEPDSGQSEAINKGLQKCNGRIINWLNSDDYYQPNILFEIAEIYNSYSPLVISGRSRIFDSASEKTLKYSKGTDVYTGNLAKTLGWARMDQPETFFTREAIDIMGALNEDLHYIMDREWWIRYLLHFGQERIYKGDEVWVNFRIHGDSKTTNHSDLFESEHLSLFHFLAKSVHENKIQDFLTQNFNIQETLAFAQLEQFIEPNKELIRQALHYQLLLQADIAYANERWELAKKSLKVINPSLLAPKDRKYLKKIFSRVTLLPKYLIRALRR